MRHFFTGLCLLLAIACSDLEFESVGASVPVKADAGLADKELDAGGPIDRGGDAGASDDAGEGDSGDGDAGSLDAEVDAGLPPVASCQDRIQNQGESDVDCGGPCGGCATGGACLIDADCELAWCMQDTCLADSFCPLYPNALFCDGFEDIQGSSWVQDTPATPVSQDQTTVFLGNSAGRGSTIESGQTSYIRGTFSAALSSGSLYMRAYYYVPSTESVQQINILSLRGGATALLSGSGRISFYLDKIQSAFPSANDILPLNQWFCLEVDLDVGPAGSVSMRLDGQQIVSVQNIDTAPATVYSGIQVPIQYTPSPTQPPVSILVDEVVIAQQPVSCDQKN